MQSTKVVIGSSVIILLLFSFPNSFGFQNNICSKRTSLNCENQSNTRRIDHEFRKYDENSRRQLDVRRERLLQIRSLYDNRDSSTVRSNNERRDTRLTREREFTPKPERSIHREWIPERREIRLPQNNIHTQRSRSYIGENIERIQIRENRERNIEHNSRLSRSAAENVRNNRDRINIRETRVSDIRDNERNREHEQIRNQRHRNSRLTQNVDNTRRYNRRMESQQFRNIDKPARNSILSRSAEENTRQKRERVEIRQLRNRNIRDNNRQNRDRTRDLERESRNLRIFQSSERDHDNKAVRNSRESEQRTRNVRDVERITQNRETFRQNKLDNRDREIRQDRENRNTRIIETQRLLKDNIRENRERQSETEIRIQNDNSRVTEKEKRTSNIQLGQRNDFRTVSELNLFKMNKVQEKMDNWINGLKIALISLLFLQIYKNKSDLKAFPLFKIPMFLQPLKEKIH